MNQNTQNSTAKSDQGEMLRMFDDISILTGMKEYAIQMQVYNAGIREIKTKLEILDQEFSTRYEYNPIHHIESRLKSPRSILEKLGKRNLPLSMDTIRANLHDIAGVRVICNYIDDVYRVADLLTGQHDIRQITRHDYIHTPKENGYRSLHMVVEVPVFLAEGPVNVMVEIQIRTIAMDFWASLEHKLRYKTDVDVSADLRHRLRICAEAISEVDVEMQDIHQALRKNGTAGKTDQNRSGIA